MRSHTYQAKVVYARIISLMNSISHSAGNVILGDEGDCIGTLSFLRGRCRRLCSNAQGSLKSSSAALQIPLDARWCGSINTCIIGY